MSDVARTPRRARARRILAAALTGMLALAGGTALALNGAPSANAAPGDVFFTTPEYTVVSHSPFQFDGEASPGDAITITSGYGPDCHAVADGLGIWSCNMVFTDSVDVTVLTVSRDVDDGNPGTQESDGQEHHISLPLIIDETTPGNVLSNANPPALTGSGAFPGAGIVGTIGAQPCTGVADGAGLWTCASAPQADGIYPSGVQQDVLGGGSGYSDVVNTLYTSDTTTPPWPESSVPYDSTLGQATTQTSQVTPTIGGGVGSTEPFSRVDVTYRDNGGPIIWPTGFPGLNPYCSDVADATGAWSCTGPALTVGSFYVITMTAVDEAGNPSGGSPDADFGIEILPPPDPPQVNNPAPGQGEISPFLADGESDPLTTTSIRIREGATDLCGVILPNGAGDWSCPGFALAPGPHTLSFDAYDTYGTFSTTTLNVDSWAPQTVTYPLPGAMTSASTIDITGTAPVGAEMVVSVDGFSVVPPGCRFVTPSPTFICTTGFLGVGFHPIEVNYNDPYGANTAQTFTDITIVPTLPAPVFITPAPGYSSKVRTVDVSMTNVAEGTVYVREGLFDLCPPTPVAVTSFSCTTSQLSVGTHTITISQTDQYGVMSATAQRTVTILPTPFSPLTRKTFEFSIQVLGADGKPIGDEGVGTGDLVTIVASNVPPGTLITAEIHSDPVALGGMTVGQTGKMVMSAVVPAVPPGAHQIVVGATADDYWPGTVTMDIQVRGLKHITDPDEIVKQLGDPEEVKQLGTPADGTGAAGGPGGSGGSDAHGFTDPSQFGSSVDSPFDAPAHAFALSPAGIVLSGSIALAFLLLVGLPAELLESTIRSNYDRAFGWLARLKRRASRMLAPVARLLARPWVGSGVTILAASIMLGFADPDFGFTGASVRLVLAMIAAVVAINIGISVIVMKAAKRAFDTNSVLQPMPAALAIVGVSVLVSRLAGISPGFLFGIVLGVAYARELKLRDEARLGILTAGLTIAAGLLAWIGYGIASATIAGQGFFNNLLIEALAAVTLEALGTLVVALLPIEFLDGRTIFRWSKPAWLGLYAVTALIFVFVVVPLSDNWGTMSAPIFGWGTLFAVFAAVAIITWAVFRRRARVRPSSREDAAPPQRSRR
jgi:hypothetical protein